MRLAAFLAFLLFTGTASADAFYKLVGYRCDKTADKLVLTYDAAANSDGEEMFRNKSAHQWDPWGLIEMKDEDHVAKLQTIKRSCKLSDGTYLISLGPIPGNMNIQRRCGAWISAWAEVRRRGQIIYPRSNFERGVGCFVADGEIVTRVEIRPGETIPRVEVHPAEQLLSGT